MTISSITQRGKYARPGLGPEYFKVSGEIPSRKLNTRLIEEFIGSSAVFYYKLKTSAENR